MNLSQTVNYTMITDKIEYEYSLDDQCRMEFDRGFSFCRSFQLADPCEHLWCAHYDTPLLCKTKKGPPMDGTACGPEKVCMMMMLMNNYGGVTVVCQRTV